MCVCVEGGGGGVRSKGEGGKGEGGGQSVPHYSAIISPRLLAVCVCRWPFQPRSRPFFACSGGCSSFVCWARAVPRRKLRSLLFSLPVSAWPSLSLSPLLTESGGRLKRSVS